MSVNFWPGERIGADGEVGPLEHSRICARTTAKIGQSIRALSVRMAAATGPAGAARGSGARRSRRPAIGRRHDRQQLAQPRAAAFGATWLRAITHQQFRLPAALLTSVFVKWHVRIPRSITSGRSAGEDLVEYYGLPHAFGVGQHGGDLCGRRFGRRRLLQVRAASLPASVPTV